MSPAADLDALLLSALKPARLTAVVDVGANPIDGEPPYRPMLEKGLCTVVGFEPQSDALAALHQAQGSLETYLPYAVRDGGTHQLHRCRAPGMTSLLRPDAHNLSMFNDFPMLGEVIAGESVETRKLDDIAEIKALDFLKIDIQGSELAVFESGREKLGQCVAIQTEVSFIPLYEGQPVFWETDRLLRSLGFVPHAFAAIKRWPIAPYVHHQHRRSPLNQLLEADLIYVRDFIRPDGLDDEQIKHLALIAHHCYGSFDLVLRCLKILESRHRVAAAAVRQYARITQGGGPGAPADLSDLSFDLEFTYK